MPVSLRNQVRVGAFRFYYAYARTLNRILPVIRLDGNPIYVAPNVYKPLENEHRLADATLKGSRVLDLGCGCGVVAVFAAAIADEVVASDISPAAVKNTRRNCEAKGLSNVTLVASDMFAAIRGKFDLIVTHPPYFHLQMKGADAQYATSVTFLKVLFQESKNYLNDGGCLLVQYPKDRQSCLEQLAAGGGLRLVDCEPIGSKPIRVLLTSWLYLQFGNETQRYRFERL